MSVATRGQQVGGLSRRRAPGAPCPLCGCAEQIELFDVSRADGRLRPVLCCACGMGFLDPAPDAASLERAYASGDWFSFDAEQALTPRVLASKRAKAADRMRWLEALRRTARGSALEIGAGEGAWVESLMSRGWRAIAIEPNHRLARRIRQVLRAPAVAGMFPACAAEVRELAPAPGYDLIAAFHVVEHARDPLAFLRVAADLLAPGGLLYLAAPDLRQPAGDLRSYFFRTPHLHYFTATTLARVVLSAGLRVIASQSHAVCGKPEVKLLAERNDAPAAAAREALALEAAALRESPEALLAILGAHDQADARGAGAC